MEKWKCKFYKNRIILGVGSISYNKLNDVPNGVYTTTTDYETILSIKNDTGSTHPIIQFKCHTASDGAYYYLRIKDYRGNWSPWANFYNHHY